MIMVVNPAYLQRRTILEPIQVSHTLKITGLSLIPSQLHSFSHDETAKALDGLNTSESIGPDLILPTVLKLAVKELAPSPTKIFYLSLTSGYYISQEMGEDWAPVFKKDDKMEKKNYRPVTVLNTVKKNL